MKVTLASYYEKDLQDLTDAELNQVIERFPVRNGSTWTTTRPIPGSLWDELRDRGKRARMLERLRQGFC